MAQRQTTVPRSTAIDFLYLSEADMLLAGVTDMAACIATMAEMLKLIHAGDYRMAGSNGHSHGARMTFPAESSFPTMPKPTADRRFVAMPAYLGGSFGTTGMKWYGSNIANREKGLPRSILMFMLNDTDTGAPLSLMSANLLSAYRTGGVPGVGARHLARADSRVVGILGPGVIARTALAAFAVACPGIDTVKIKARGRRSLDDFQCFVRRELPQITTVTVVDTVEDVVRDSDIVTYCASGAIGDTSAYPIVKREWVSPGTFLVMPAPCDIDEGMQLADVRKIVDCSGLYEAWAAELPKPTHRYCSILGCKFMDMIEAGTMMREQLEEISRIVAGEAPGRCHSDEIILMSVGGMPVEDVAWGTVIHRRAQAQGIGVSLNLWDSPAMR